MSLKTEDIPWIEKYRPTKFGDIVLDPTNKITFQNILSKKYFPHLLFYGPPGTGKTTTIINLIHEYQVQQTGGVGQPTSSLGKNKENVIHLNASDERGIDIIRNQINSFVKSNHLFESGMKFVILDEVDYMTKNAQLALKTLIQTTASNVRFCLICNYISKIESSLINEFMCIRFNQLPKKDIEQFIQHIAKSENLDITAEWIEIIQSMYYSDIRSMVNFMQLRLNDGAHNRTTTLSRKIWDELFAMLRTHTQREIYQYIHANSVDYNTDKRKFMNLFVDYIIRFHSEILTAEFLTGIQQVIHANDTPIDLLVNFMISTLVKAVHAYVPAVAYREQEMEVSAI